MKVISKQNKKTLPMKEIEFIGNCLFNQELICDYFLNGLLNFNLSYNFNLFFVNHSIKKELKIKHPFLNHIFEQNNIDFAEYVESEDSRSFSFQTELKKSLLESDDFLKFLSLDNFSINAKYKIYLDLTTKYLFHLGFYQNFDHKYKNSYLIEIMDSNSFINCVKKTIIDFINNKDSLVITINHSLEAGDRPRTIRLNVSFSDKEELRKMILADIYNTLYLNFDTLKKRAKDLSTESFLKEKLPISLLTKTKLRNFVRQYPAFFEQNKDCMLPELFDQYLAIKNDIDSKNKKEDLIKSLYLLKNRESLDNKLSLITKESIKGVDLSKPYFDALIKTIKVRKVNSFKLEILQKLFDKLNSLDDTFADKLSDLLSEKTIQLEEIHLCNLICLADFNPDVGRIDLSNYNSLPKFSDKVFLKTLFSGKKFEVELFLNRLSPSTSTVDTSRSYTFANWLNKLFSELSIVDLRIDFKYKFYQDMYYHNIQYFLDTNINHLENFVNVVKDTYFIKKYICLHFNDYDKEILNSVKLLHNSLSNSPDLRVSDFDKRKSEQIGFFEKLGLN